jgi:hypothetical protein
VRCVPAVLAPQAPVMMCPLRLGQAWPRFCPNGDKFGGPLSTVSCAAHATYAAAMLLCVLLLRGCAGREDVPKSWVRWFGATTCLTAVGLLASNAHEWSHLHPGLATLASPPALLFFTVQGLAMGLSPRSAFRWVAAQTACLVAVQGATHSFISLTMMGAELSAVLGWVSVTVAVRVEQMAPMADDDLHERLLGQSERELRSSYADASLLNQITFTWMNTLLTSGWQLLYGDHPRKIAGFLSPLASACSLSDMVMVPSAAGVEGPKSLKLDDIPALPEAVLAQSQFARWQTLWEADTASTRSTARQASVVNTALRTFIRPFALSGIILLLSSASPLPCPVYDLSPTRSNQTARASAHISQHKVCDAYDKSPISSESAPISGVVTGVLQYAGPLLLHRLVMFMASGDTSTPEPLTTGVSLSLLLGLARCCQSMADHQYAFKAKILGLHLRAVMQAAVYRKSLRISQGAPMSFTWSPVVGGARTAHVWSSLCLFAAG